MDYPERDNTFTFLLIGAAIIFALIFGGDGKAPVRAPSNTAITISDSFNDNSSRVCIGWCTR